MSREVENLLFDVSGQLTLGGSAGAYTVRTARPLRAYNQGFWVRAKANHTNTGAATLNVREIGARDIKDLKGNDGRDCRRWDLRFRRRRFAVFVAWRNSRRGRCSGFNRLYHRRRRIGSHDRIKRQLAGSVQRGDHGRISVGRSVRINRCRHLERQHRQLSAD